MSDPRPKPGQGIIELALAARDTDLLRKIAAERKGLTDQQRNARNSSPTCSTGRQTRAAGRP